MKWCCDGIYNNGYFVNNGGCIGDMNILFDVIDCGTMKEGGNDGGCMIAV